ncbi:hypothetical protein DCAR_0831908 [Daucus carota subsp. sativus]|uniref:C2H2-type domain-containing protein n=1 Tax=Daucus carota subsp. sativus TaxID=79200 RepID=A0A175YPB5_DAUCS|nr:PREDICTED: probable transcriptional regulator RABBIT EARS [Daucus carota subsp. sativus]WOH12405.1 hypothetical protein DCAR_0831908 [Daucus carota subsp. sativus]
MEHYSQYLRSWEEQAFAEDVGEGLLGGFIWPPRCYSCSFCNRIFKSAQALGGHMNVHRRDRARLNQPLCLKTGGADKFFNSKSPNSLYSETEAVKIIQGTKKLACRNPILRKESAVETGLSVGLNFCVEGNRGAERTGVGGDIKRRRTDCLLYIDCSSSDKDGIDLELRLGDSPTVLN